MLLHMNFWGPVVRSDDPNNYRAACNVAFEDFTVWRRSHRISSSQKRFTYWSTFREEYGCLFQAKGHNARIVSAWLEDCLERSQVAPPPGMLHDNRVPLCLATLSFGLKRARIDVLDF